MVKTSIIDQEQQQREQDNIRFKGVRKRKWGKWVSEIRLPNSRERIWLGSYDTPEKAARAFDAALYCLRGKQAKFNFPLNPLPDIQDATSLKPHQIQIAAANFANQNHSISSSSSSSLSLQDFNHFNNNNNNNINSLVVLPTSPPSSDSGIHTESDLSTAMDWSLFMNESETSTPDFGHFGGLDDFLAPELDFVNYYYEQEQFNIGGDDGGGGGGGDCSQTSFLWNF